MFIILFLLFCDFSRTFQTCSWEKCNAWSQKDGVINVHLVPHTHDDLGWIKTVDQYYYGAKPQLVPVGVQYIYNTVIDELQKNPERRFSFAETGFLWRWYNSHSDFEKHKLQKLVKTGQIEMIGGGWVQNDEASTHYVDVVDQMTLGLKKLDQVFGECGKPKVAWQIDPFGHSKEQANLFAMMGFTSLFFARIHYLEKEARLKNKSLEFIWNSSEDLKTQILTGVFYQDNYGPPEGFCFDALCGDDPIMDDPDMEEYNLDKKISAFVVHVKKQASFLRSSHVMLLMGSDFQYTNANTWYTNMDKLIRYVNENNTHGVQVFYSTPSCYVKAVMDTSTQVHLPTKSDDFFPYASSNHSYWTGYFTSRPALKGMIREASSLLQLCKQLDALADIGPEDDADVETMARASALAQHHDAVTGTAKENVTRDYEKRLAVAAKEGEVIINDYLKKIYPKNVSMPPRHHICPLVNETICNIIKHESTFAVTVFNSNSRQYSGFVTIPYYSKQAIVMNPKEERVLVQLTKTFQVNSMDTNVRAPYELVLPVDVGPLGYATYIVDNSSSVRSATPQPSALQPLEQPVFIQNEEYFLTFDNHGLVSTLVEKATNVTHPFRQEFFYYLGVMNGSQPSGAYIFRPEGEPVGISNAQLEVVKGPHVEEVRQIFNSWVAQVIRLKKNAKHVEFDWIIGPIPKEEKNPITKEVVTRYITDIKNEDVFFTDSNGRQMMRRQKNFNPSFKYVDTEPISGNYYPVTNRAYLKDDNKQLTILTDRSQGATSFEGVLEIMLHRRCFADDHWGVEEALDEPGDGNGLVLRGTHYVLLGNTKESILKNHRLQPSFSLSARELRFVSMDISWSSLPQAQRVRTESYKMCDDEQHYAMAAAAIHRPLAVDIFHRPFPTFVKVQNITAYSQSFKMEFSSMTRPLPEFAHLMTIERWHRRSLLLRIEHIFQNQEDVENSKPMNVELKDLFSQFKIVSMTELMLAGNRNITNYTRDRPRRYKGNFQITLKPMEIRTFKVDIEWL